jgi:hypothetical protein
MVEWSVTSFREGSGAEQIGPMCTLRAQNEHAQIRHLAHVSLQSLAASRRETIMVKRFVVVASLALLLGVVAEPSAHADTRFSIQVGPGYWSSAPGPGYVWQDGYQVWTGYGYRWIPGEWVRSYGGRNWARERWERDHRAFHRSWDDSERRRDRYRDDDRDRYRDDDRRR